MTGQEEKPAASGADRRRLTRIDRFCRLFTDVHPGEGVVGLRMAFNILLILVAYYMIKPIREGWISMENLPGLTKMEIKAYASYGQSLFLLWVITIYDGMVSTLPRGELIRRSTLFCIVVQLIFWVLQPNLFVDRIPGIGILFSLWVGMFGAFMVAQTWTFIVDLYNNERGRRLLPMVAIGGTSGAVVGSWLVDLLMGSSFPGEKSILLLANIPLFITWVLSSDISIDPRHQRSGQGFAPGFEDVVPPRGSTFDLVLKNRFLFRVALITLLLNWVNSNGENLLFRVVVDVLQSDISLGGTITDMAQREALLNQGIITFYSQFFFWVNVLALILQALIASRLVKYGGFTTVMLLLPLLVLTSSIAIVLLPILSVIKVMKIIENAADYSINNTARNILWLPMSLEVKFKAKTTIDSLFARLGDGMAAATVLFGVHTFNLTTQEFFVFNLGLVCVWLMATVQVVREHNRITI